MNRLIVNRIYPLQPKPDAQQEQDGAVLRASVSGLPCFSYPCPYPCDEGRAKLCPCEECGCAEDAEVCWNFRVPEGGERSRRARGGEYFS
jgi:hypothetical protein